MTQSKKPSKKKRPSKYDTVFHFDISSEELFKLTFQDADEKIKREQSKKPKKKKD